MDKPYIFCHMLTSLDGKIMGSFMDTKESYKAGKVFYNISFGKNSYYKHQGWLSGRITTDDNFTFYKRPKLEKNLPIVEDGDFVAEISDMYYISVDPSGKLGWVSNILRYDKTRAHIIEVLTEKVSNDYKSFLRKLKISYIVCGEDKLNYELIMDKLKNIFGIKTLMLGGGGVLNWSFIQAGMCDELSIVISPSADGSNNTPSLFSISNGLSNDSPVSFNLKNVEVKDGGSVWLRYLIKR